MHVVHPYPTRLNPSASRYSIRPLFRRYSVTTLEPGARLVFTHGCRLRPRNTAFRASRPAPIMTLGFEVFVQLVIAAITTAPCVRSGSTATISATATAAPPAVADTCAEPPASAPFFGDLILNAATAPSNPFLALSRDPR